MLGAGPRKQRGGFWEVESGVVKWGRIRGLARQELCVIDGGWPAGGGIWVTELTLVGYPGDNKPGASGGGLVGPRVHSARIIWPRMGPYGPV